jgi:cytochrome c oxidase assembly protein subunit 15
MIFDFPMFLRSQASVGWWMVKSGLETTAHSYNDLPRVSPYRLATHLITAFAIYSLLFTTGYRLIQSSRLLRLLQSNQPFPSDAIPSSLRISSILVAKLVGLTAFSGAFVAGNEAGLVYSDFPLMGGQWVPDDLINQHITPVWKNLFENSALVQFNHRYLGMFTAGSCAALYLLCRRIPLPPSAASASKHLIAMALLQVSLGISTLMMHVPTSLAAAHQAGSLALLTCALWLALSLRPVSVAANLVRNPAVRQAAKKIML